MEDRYRASSRGEAFTVAGAPHGIGGEEKNPAFQQYKTRMVDWWKATLR